MPPRENREEEHKECQGCGDSKENTTSGIIQEHEGISKTLCTECFYEVYDYCYSCSEVIEIDHSYSNSCNDRFCPDCFYEYHESCTECGHTMDREGGEIHWYNDYAYCYDCKPDDTESLVDRIENSIQTPNSSRIAETFVYPIHRLVGLEVECIVPSDDECIDTPLYWSNVGDGSISTDGEGMGVEMVSSPASGDLLLENINSIIGWRDDYSAYVNSSCGFHVHFNSLDLSAREVSHIAIVYQKYQKVFKSMMPNSRQSSNWCRDSLMIPSQLRRVESEYDLIELYYSEMGSTPSTNKYNDARYCGMNIHSRYYHGTIEFRLHSGTINKEKITNWISILNCIILKGLEISKFSNENFKSWMELRPNLDIFGQTLKSYICKRISKFQHLRG